MSRREEDHGIKGKVKKNGMFIYTCKCGYSSGRCPSPNAAIQRVTAHIQIRSRNNLSRINAKIVRSSRA